MTRISVDQYTSEGVLLNGYDYANQAWVVDGVYVRCGHPETMGCHCFGRAHAGESVKPDRAGKHGHHIDCDGQEIAEHNFLCSVLCPLTGNLSAPIMTIENMKYELSLYGGYDEDELDRLEDRRIRDFYADYLGIERAVA